MKCQCGWKGPLAMIRYDGPIGIAQTAPMCLVCRIERREELGASAHPGAVPCRM